MTRALAERAHRCHEEFLAMVDSMEKATASLKDRFTVAVKLTNGTMAPLLGSNALHEKFREYLERAQARWLEKQLQLGVKHADYQSFLASLPSAARQETENRTTVRAWSAAKGPFLEALCLLADTSRSSRVGPVVQLPLFMPTGPIEILQGGQQLFVWVQPTLVGTRSRMNACPDIVITREPNVQHTSVVAIRECKCHRRLPSDEIRKECGKATDLIVDSYVIVTYHTQRAKKVRGAAALGLRIEGIGLDTADRERYVSGEQNLVVDLARKLARDDEEALFRTRMEGDGVVARERQERER